MRTLSANMPHKLTMIKFKMKLLLLLGVSVFMTVSMILYSSLFSENGLQDLWYDDNQTSDLDNFIWGRFVRNPITSFNVFDTELVDAKDSKSLSNLPEIPISFVKNDDEFITLREDAVVVKSIDHLIDNKLYEDRRDLMLNECSKLYGKSSVLKLRKSKLEHILVDEKNKILFCYVPKVACTNWKRMFMLISGKTDNVTVATNLPSYEIHAKNMFASLQNYSNHDVDYFIRNYSKFVFVRNPFERLLSAYRNKLEQHYNSSKYFQSRFGKYIIKKFRVNPSNISLAKGDDVTFAEFVRYLVSSSKEIYNEHWQTINDLCLPCFLKYDFIGKYDTLLTDAQAVLNIFRLNVSFPSLAKPSKTADSLKTYFAQLPSSLLEELNSIYEADFRIFDYSVSETLFQESLVGG